MVQNASLVRAVASRSRALILVNTCSQARNAEPFLERSSTSKWG